MNQWIRRPIGVPAGVILVLGLLSSGALSPSKTATASSPLSALSAQSVGRYRAAVSHRPQQAMASLPISFEANRGQVNRQVTFLTHGPGYTLHLTERGPLFVYEHHIGTTSRPDERAAPCTTRIRYTHAASADMYRKCRTPAPR
jgi:hypothetical protein